MKLKKLLAAVLCGALVLSGCSLFNGGESSNDQSSAVISSIPESSAEESSNESSEESAQHSKNPDPERHFIELEMDETYDIHADQTAELVSADPDIAFVNDKREIEGKSPGKTKIRVIFEGVTTDIYTVTVKEQAVLYSLPEVSGHRDDNNIITPTVWEVTDKSGHTIYMMGSIHVGDEDMLYLPDYFMAAFDQCDYLGVECDTTKADTSSGLDALKDYLYTDGTKITDHVDRTAYDNMVTILTNYGRFTSVLNNYKPFLWVEYVEMTAAMTCNLNAAYGVENVVTNIAVKDRKKLIELESVEMQTQMLAELNDEMQEMLFNAYADPKMFENVQDQTKEILDLWKTGKMTDENMTTDYDEYEKEIARISDPEKKAQAEKELKLYRDYNDALLVHRNKNMAEKIKGYLDSDMKVMVVVGSGHFYGDNGIVSLLRDKGCTIRTMTTEDAKKLGYDMSKVA